MLTMSPRLDRKVTVDVIAQCTAFIYTESHSNPSSVYILKVLVRARYKEALPNIMNLFLILCFFSCSLLWG